MLKAQAKNINKIWLSALMLIAPVSALAATINGRVTDASNQPVSDLNMCLLERSSNSFGGLVPPGTMLQTQCKRTNVSGDYSLITISGNPVLVMVDENDIQARQLNLIAEYHTGERVSEKVPSQVATFTPSTQNINDLNFKLDAGYRFRGKITDEHNLPILNVFVCVSSLLTSGGRCYTSNDAGEFSTLPLAPGNYWLMSYNQMGYVDLLHNGQMVFAAAATGMTPPILTITSQDITAVNFKLQRGYAIHGSVSDYKDTLTSLGLVCIYSKSQTAILQPLGCSLANGSFKTPLLPPGSYVVVTTNRSQVFGSTITGDLYNTLDQAAQTPVLITNADVTALKLYANLAVNISGKVVDESGKGMAAATVCFHRRNMQGAYSTMDCRQTDLTGSYSSARIPAGYYAISAGRNTAPEIDHNGTAVPASGVPTELSTPLDIGASRTVNFQLRQGMTLSQLRSGVLALASRVLDLDHTREWNQASTANDIAVSAFLQELIHTTNGASKFRESNQITDQDALGLIRSATEGLRLVLDAAEHGVTLDSPRINGSIAAVASLIKTLNVYDAELNIIYRDPADELEVLAEELLKSTARLRSLQQNIDDVRVTNSALGLLIASLFSQVIQLENNLRYPLEQFAAFTGDAVGPALQQLFSVHGIKPNSLDSQGITAALKANALLLQQYLRLTAVELKFDSDWRRLDQSLRLPESSTEVREYFNNIGSSDQLIWINQAGRAAYPFDTIQQALAIENSEFFIRDVEFLLDIITDSDPFRVASGKILLVPPQIPDGVVTLPDGSVLFTRDSLSIQVVPAPMNVFALDAALRADGQLLNLKNDGGMAFVYKDKLVSATMNFQTDGFPHDAEETARIIPPASFVSNNPDSLFRIQYSNGSSQTLAPFVSATGFFDSLAVRGLPYTLNRQTGVVLVNLESYRPAFEVLPTTAEELVFYQQTKDAEGLAYLPGDFNSDGLVDYKILDGSTTQIAYRIQ